jgi:genome maintenance exonuclease 1
MAEQIIKNGLTGSLSEIWGSEVTVHYPGLYAGATDVVGVYEGHQSIVDFKQTNKPKKREWIGDYFLQLGAYAMAHNYVYGTGITQGVILMCSKDNYFQRFTIDGQEFINQQHNFLRRVDEYYEQRNRANEAQPS